MTEIEQIERLIDYGPITINRYVPSHPVHGEPYWIVYVGVQDFIGATLGGAIARALDALCKGAKR
jgi:hypothetical protein